MRHIVILVIFFISIIQNSGYNKENAYFVCPIGQHMEKVGDGTRQSDSGFILNGTFYEAKNCALCSLKRGYLESIFSRDLSFATCL
jgi:hypothetical protein